MPERAYTVREIDALRQAIRNKELYGSYQGSPGMSASYREPDLTQKVEAMVRTHMLAGHVAADLTGTDTVFVWTDTPTRD